MIQEPVKDEPSIRTSILEVIARIRRTAQSRKPTDLPTSSFSNAINSVGELFVDLLLQNERRGRWWLGDNGQWLECSVKTYGVRGRRNFIRGQSTDWDWFPRTASRLADPMTGPDHVVVVAIPCLSLSTHVVLEQKLRFATKQDAFASSSTYVKHLVAGLDCAPPGKHDFAFDSYYNCLMETTKAFVCKTKKDGTLSYSGSVPHVCLVSIGSSPHKVFVQARSDEATVECEYVGFLSPSIDRKAFAMDSPHRKIIQQAHVRLWIGLDELIDQCSTDEVEAAWDTAICGLSKSVRCPEWTN